MSHGLPDDWYEEHDGQRLVLDSEKVAAEIKRLRAALQQIADDPYMDPDGNREHCLRALGQRMSYASAPKNTITTPPIMSGGPNILLVF